MSPASVSKPVEIAGTQLPFHEGHVVLLGANGSGKSTLGIQVTTAAVAGRISARRALSIGDSIPLQQLTQATSEYDRQTNSSRRNRVTLVSDFQHVLTRLLAEETEHARSIRAQIISGKKQTFSTDDAKSSVDLVTGIWEPLFPGRTLNFADHSPTVVGLGGRKYKQQELSDGELQALYLIGKVALESNRFPILVVDEPEIHLHNALARRLWDAVEQEFKDTRFMYLTHDIPFALSRTNARIAVVRSGQKISVLPDSSQVPEDVRELIIGAVTATASNDRHILFCEGDSSSIDAPLFEAMYRHNNVEVVPAGGCDAVVRCVQYHNDVVGPGSHATGIVDRDERCSEELDWLRSQGIHVLPVAELEQLYALPAVANLVGVCLLKRDEEVVDKAVRNALERFRSEKERLLHQHACRFAVERIRWSVQFPKKAVSPGPDLHGALQNLKNEWEKSVALDPSMEINNAHSTLQEGLKGDVATLFRLFSGKSVVENMSRELGMDAKLYREMVVGALLGKHGTATETRIRGLLRAAFPADLAPKDPKPVDTPTEEGGSRADRSSVGA